LTIIHTDQHQLLNFVLEPVYGGFREVNPELISRKQ